MHLSLRHEQPKIGPTAHVSTGARGVFVASAAGDAYVPARRWLLLVDAVLLIETRRVAGLRGTSGGASSGEGRQVRPRHQTRLLVQPVTANNEAVQSPLTMTSQAS